MTVRPDVEQAEHPAESKAYFALASALEERVTQGMPPMMPMLRRLFPICRSLTGDGVRETLNIIGETIPLERRKAPTGTRCFDWTVPREWNIRDAYVKNSKGERVIDFADSNLHVVGYSIPVNVRLSLSELQEHLHSIPDYPDAIPYRTSYYDDYWGFCLADDQRRALTDDTYEVLIDSSLESGQLDFAESRVKGLTDRAVFLSTYVCHPSMANNELSGPVLVSTLLALLQDLPTLRYSYRALFAPETIGAILFLSQHYRELQESVVAGYVVSCVGDDGPYTYVRSRRADTMADKVADHVLRHCHEDRRVTVKDFDPIGSDERQYGSPGIDLPIGSLSRSRHGEYREYHTSKDDLDFVSERGIAGSLAAYLRAIQVLEMNCRPTRTDPFCEPQLGRRGLYPKLGAAREVDDYLTKLMHILAFSDGDHDLIDIANRLGCPVWGLREPLEKLVDADLVRLNIEAA